MTKEEIDAILSKTLQDHRLTRSERQALDQVIVGAQAPELFRARAFELARQTVTCPEDRNVIEWLESVVKATFASSRSNSAGMDSEAYFSPRDDCVAKITQLFSKARRQVDICVFTITDDRITTAILDAHRRGIAIRIITDNDKTFDQGSDIPRIRSAGIPVREDQTQYHMHHKFAIFDRESLLNGSYNWTRGAARDNQENFILTSEQKLITTFQDAFERLWKQFGSSR